MIRGIDRSREKFFFGRRPGPASRLHRVEVCGLKWVHGCWSWWQGRSWTPRARRRAKDAGADQGCKGLLMRTGVRLNCSLGAVSRRQQGSRRRHCKGCRDAPLDQPRLFPALPLPAIMRSPLAVWFLMHEHVLVGPEIWQRALSVDWRAINRRGPCLLRSFLAGVTGSRFC